VVIAGGRTICARGQCLRNLDVAENIGSLDLVEPSRTVMQSDLRLNEHYGGRMQHQVKVMAYRTDVRHREAADHTMDKDLNGVHPVLPRLAVRALARPGWLLEINGTAVIPTRRHDGFAGGAL